MFAVIYQPSNEGAKCYVEKGMLFSSGEWRVDTDPDTGKLETYDDLEIALDRVKNIRDKGGEACLSVVIE